MSNLEIIECFGHELKAAVKWGAIDENCKSLFHAIIQVLKEYDNISLDMDYTPDDLEMIVAFKKEYEIFSKLKVLGEKEGIL